MTRFLVERFKGFFIKEKACDLSDDPRSHVILANKRANSTSKQILLGVLLTVQFWLVSFILAGLHVPKKRFFLAVLFERFIFLC